MGHRHTHAVYKEEYGGTPAIVLTLGDLAEDASEVDVRAVGSADRLDLIVTNWMTDRPSSGVPLFGGMTMFGLLAVPKRREDPAEAIEFDEPVEPESPATPGQEVVDEQAAETRSSRRFTEVVQSGRVSLSARLYQNTDTSAGS